MIHSSSYLLSCLPACKSRPLAPRASLSLERFAAALCTLLQQWIRAADSRRRAARWRWLCLVLPDMFSARPLRFLGNAAGSVKGGAATEHSEACP